MAIDNWTLYLPPLPTTTRAITVQLNNGQSDNIAITANVLEDGSSLTLIQQQPLLGPIQKQINISQADTISFPTSSVPNVTDDLVTSTHIWLPSPFAAQYQSITQSQSDGVVITANVLEDGSTLILIQQKPLLGPVQYQQRPDDALFFSAIPIPQITGDLETITHIWLPSPFAAQYQSLTQSQSDPLGSFPFIVADDVNIPKPVPPYKATAAIRQQQINSGSDTLTFHTPPIDDAYIQKSVPLYKATGALHQQTVSRSDVPFLPMVVLDDVYIQKSVPLYRPKAALYQQTISCSDVTVPKSVQFGDEAYLPKPVPTYKTTLAIHQQQINSCSDVPFLPFILLDEYYLPKPVPAYNPIAAIRQQQINGNSDIFFIPPPGIADGLHINIPYRSPIGVNPLLLQIRNTYNDLILIPTGLDWAVDDAIVIPTHYRFVYVPDYGSKYGGVGDNYFAAVIPALSTTSVVKAVVCTTTVVPAPQS